MSMGISRLRASTSMLSFKASRFAPVINSPQFTASLKFPCIKVQTSGYVGKVNKTIFKKLDENTAPENVNPELYREFANFMNATIHEKLTHPLPKRSFLHTFIQKASNSSEAELVRQAVERWRKYYELPMNQKTTWIILSKCQHLKKPDLLITMLLDQWNYRLYPTMFVYDRLNKLISERINVLVELEGQESDAVVNYLDDMFRLFASMPQYGVPHNKEAYSSLVFYCAKSTLEEGWIRACQVAEEALSPSEATGLPHGLNYEAASILAKEYEIRGDSKNAEIYQNYITEQNLKPTPAAYVNFDQNGMMTLVDHKNQITASDI